MIKGNGELRLIYMYLLNSEEKKVNLFQQEPSKFESGGGGGAADRLETIFSDSSCKNRVVANFSA
jgi:hypothetical protein